MQIPRSNLRCFTSARAHTSGQLVYATFGTKFSITHKSDVPMSPTNTTLPSWLGHLSMSESSWDQHILPSGYLCAALNNILCYLLTPESKPCSCSTSWLLTTAATCRFTFTGILAQFQLEITEEDAVKHYGSHSVHKSWLCFYWNMVC